MLKDTQHFNHLVMELIEKIEAARIECQRMRTLLRSTATSAATAHLPAGAASASFPTAQAPLAPDNIIDARARFADSR